MLGLRTTLLHVIKLTHKHLLRAVSLSLSPDPQVAAVVAKAKELMSSKATDVEVRQLEKNETSA